MIDLTVWWNEWLSNHLVHCPLLPQPSTGVKSRVSVTIEQAQHNPSTQQVNTHGGYQ